MRELENTLERAITLCEGDCIATEDLLIPKKETTQQEIQSDLPLEQHLDQIERQVITKALEETHWNRTAAAKKLGISFRALRYRFSKLGIE